MPPLVSILIPCYNARKWVGQAIESALAQTWTEMEVVVVDDGSTDGSVDVIRSFGDRIRWETGPNRGGNPTRNRLLEMARGEWIQYLDADDYLLPSKVAMQVEFLKARPDVDVVYSPILLQQEGEMHSEPVPNPYPINTEDLWVGLVRWHTPQTGGFLYSHRALTEVGAWNENQPCCQDNELTLRLLIHGKRFAFSPAAGAVYRLWSQQTVSQRNQDQLRERRLDIIRQAEIFLRDQNQLTPARRWAVNQARFEIARTTWPVAPNLAEKIFHEIRESFQAFRPGPPVPLSYRICFRLFGFVGAERIAALSRRWKVAPGH